MSRKYIKWNAERDNFILEYTENHGRQETAEEFERRFGVPISKENISGRKLRLRNRRAGRRVRPKRHDGYEWKNRHGYTMVIVGGDDGGEYSIVPKARIEWERHHGTELPENHVVFFANKDKGDFSAENLVAVPRRLVPFISRPHFYGLPDYHDRETMDALIAIASVEAKVNDIELSERICKDCGRTFKPAFKTNVRCRECIEKRKARRNT